MNIYSTVEYLPYHSGYSCGYCKSSDTNYNNGMWAHVLTVEDYQNLIDRGWRRSGAYCYKPTMELTCCPLYTIRCDVTNLKISKSQKKILKRMSKFLKDGMKDSKNEEFTADNDSTGEPEGENVSEVEILERVVDKVKTKNISTEVTIIDKSVNVEKVLEESKTTNKFSEPQPSSSIKDIQDNNKKTSLGTTVIETPNLKTPRPGDGIDHNKPQCKKAKILRLEKKRKKILQNQNFLEVCKSNNACKEKTLEDFIKESQQESSANSLEVRLLPVDSEPEMIKASWHVFVKYQTAIHKESEYECSYRTFRDFLVTSPLQPYKDKNGPPSGYGSFHQQYWLNGKLIAVGVIDILPKCISSVYFFYDPDYSFLSLGTYSSLRELELVRSYATKCPDLKYYYMGFYIHSCPKMRYKARITPSYLLCPEVYSWHRVEDCVQKLDINKYSRLNEDIDALCEDSKISLNQVLVLWNNTAMTYGVLRSKRRKKDEEEVKEYADLVGRNASQNMLLFRN